MTLPTLIAEVEHRVLAAEAAARALPLGSRPELAAAYYRGALSALRLARDLEAGALGHPKLGDMPGDAKPEERAT